jgi:hypothetical protein
MAQQRINVGSGEYSGNGESLRSAFTKTNANFDEVYTNLNDVNENIINILSTSTASQLVNGNQHVVLNGNGLLIFSDGFTVEPIINQTAIYSGLISTGTTKAISIATGIAVNGIYIPGTTLNDPVGLGNTNTIRINGKNGVAIISGDDNRGHSTSTWIFGSTGTLTLPVGGRINGKNSVAIISESVNTGTTSTISSTWIFGSTGTLTLPVGGRIINLIELDGGDSLGNVSTNTNMLNSSVYSTESTISNIDFGTFELPNNGDIIDFGNF